MDFEENEDQQDRRYIVLLFTSQYDENCVKMEQVFDDISGKVKEKLAMFKVDI
jgi:hypothetical protein